jgi:alkylation response protein AidB-like acyl-CoA dehydrogenase
MTSVEESSTKADPTAEQLILERIGQLLSDHDPKQTPRREMLGAQFDAGLAWVHFPPDCGGLGLSPKLQSVVRERLGAAGVPYPLAEQGIGTGMAAPTLLTYTKGEYRRRHLRAIFTGEEIWCQLFSEPGAGSDVANLATSAVRDGDEWVINGQKVWTTFAHIADWGLLLARTDPSAPKHSGLTYFVIDMRQPQVQARPIHQIDGSSEFNEVFFMDARVPDTQRLAEVGDGWRVAITTLMNERVAIGGSSTVPRGSGPIRLAMTAWNDQGARQTSRDELMRLWCRAEVNRLTAMRAEAARKSGTPGPEGSVGKLAFAELIQDIANFATNHLGSAGMLFPIVEDPSGARAGEDPRVLLMFARSLTIAGGTSEVMRNILGERVLGLPGEPRVDKDLPWNTTLRN